MNPRLLERMAALQREGRSFAVATIVGTRGSVPAGLGARLIVLADGTQEGTVGGAELEVRVREEARAALADGRPRTFHYDLTVKKEGGLELACGGSVDVLIEPMEKRPHVLICGGGHIGLELSRLCGPLDYDFSVLDDRPEYASAERFPRARGLHARMPEARDPYTHVVVCGYSPLVETEVLAELLARPFDGWVGLIGSKAKKKSIWDALAGRGIPAARLDRVEIPIGVPIEAETPAEIALSILGSVVREHRRKG